MTKIILSQATDTVQMKPNSIAPPPGIDKLKLERVIRTFELRKHRADLFQALTWVQTLKNSELIPPVSTKAQSDKLLKAIEQLRKRLKKSEFYGRNMADVREYVAPPDSIEHYIGFLKSRHRVDVDPISITIESLEWLEKSVHFLSELSSGTSIKRQRHLKKAAIHTMWGFWESVPSKSHAVYRKGEATSDGVRFLIDSLSLVGLGVTVDEIIAAAPSGVRNSKADLA